MLGSNRKTRTWVRDTECQLAFQAQTRGELARAVELYERCIATQETATARWNLAIAYDHLGRSDDVKRERADQLDPEIGSSPATDAGAQLP